MQLVPLRDGILAAHLRARARHRGRAHRLWGPSLSPQRALSKLCGAGGRPMGGQSQRGGLARDLDRGVSQPGGAVDKLSPVDP